MIAPATTPAIPMHATTEDREANRATRNLARRVVRAQRLGGLPDAFNELSENLGWDLDSARAHVCAAAIDLGEDGYDVLRELGLER